MRDNGILWIALGFLIMGCIGGILLLRELPGIQERILSERPTEPLIIELSVLRDAIFRFKREHDGSLPADILDKNGKPILSWRLVLLPYCPESDLVQEYDRNASWEDPRNSLLLKKMPKVFQHSGDELSNQNGNTHFCWNNGGKSPSELSDLIVVEVRYPVPWTKPNGNGVIRATELGFAKEGGCYGITGGGGISFVELPQGSVVPMPKKVVAHADFTWSRGIRP